MSLPNTIQNTPKHVLPTTYNRSILLITGNGFDINLGLNTKYKDYVESDFWPLTNDGSQLAEFIKDNIYLENWYDLEGILAKYCIEHIDNLEAFGLIDTKPFELKLEEDKQTFASLKNGLSQHIVNVENDAKIKTTSLAGLVLNTICSHNKTPTIYTFNYTSMDLLVEYFGGKKIDVKHVHGKVHDDIILGVGDSYKIKEPYVFLYKTNDDKYQSSKIIKDLEEHDIVIIFGHSLSVNDYPYFESFFSKIASGELTDKIVRIVTKDKDSKRQIKQNLREMNSDLVRIYNNSDFEIIAAEGEPEKQKALIQTLIPQPPRTTPGIKIR